MKKQLPATPGELAEALCAIFPEFGQFQSEFDEESYSTFHSVVMDFTPWFGGHFKSLSERQLRSFAELVSGAGENKGDLENAFDTCLLEHLHQIRASGFRRFLREADGNGGQG